MQTQKHLFQLPADIHYLNCAYMSPLLQSVEEAGITALQRKRNPTAITANDFFDESIELRKLFAQLVNCPAPQVAVIPSASYGLQNAINNIPVNKGNHTITVADEFPSDYYPLKKWCADNNKKLHIIGPGSEIKNKAKTWNEKILEAITNDTTAIVLSSVHWMNGTLFDLNAIGKRCKETGTLFIVDGAQSVGALPIDVTACNIDALICVAYKWLLGPYSIGAAYYSEAFNNGTPIEESWMNRSNARDFAKLTLYSDDYFPGAARYSVGESANFALTPAFMQSLKQILQWGTENIQEYCGELSKPLINFLKEKGATVEEDTYRANHLFGFTLPGKIDSINLMAELQKRKIFVSVRGESVRVSPHLYNDEKDISIFIEALNQLL